MHADSIAKLEASLRQTYMSRAATPACCAKPAMPPNYADTSRRADDARRPSTPQLSGVDYYIPDTPDSHPHLDLGLNQLRLIKTAFACDLVRVATFMWSAGTNWVVFPGTFQGATHQGQPAVDAAPPAQPQRSELATPATRDWLNQISQFYSAATATGAAGVRDHSPTSTATC